MFRNALAASRVLMLYVVIILMEVVVYVLMMNGVILMLLSVDVFMYKLIVVMDVGKITLDAKFFVVLWKRFYRASS